MRGNKINVALAAALARLAADSAHPYQRIVDAILMKIADVIANQAAKMLLIQRDDVVEDLSAKTANPSLRGCVLPGRLHACSLGLQTGHLQELDHVSTEVAAGPTHLAVILEKRQPPLTRVSTVLDTPQITSNGPFRDDEAEFLEFSVDLG